MGAPPRITCFLIKIASRCNLACDYCYVYEHADQSWREQPRVMSEDVRRALAFRIGEYAAEADLEELIVVFHGGEPLLAGPHSLVETATWIRDALPPSCHASFSMQTNGVLLDDEALVALANSDVSISLSMDGPLEIQDRHRLTIRGRSSYRQVRSALERLTARPSPFGGVIAVIDPKTEPQQLLDFFATAGVKDLDLLLPDANYDRPPPGRDHQVDLYSAWLRAAFDAWFDKYPDMRIRTFDALLGAIVGLPSGTDAFGLGDVTLLTVETDGSYHDLDVLKITEEGATALGGDVVTTSVLTASSSAGISAHRRLLQLDGLAQTCRSCPEVDVCGGGSVPHRYSSSSGFDNPSVYCSELLGLIGHARTQMMATLASASEARVLRTSDLDIVAFEAAQSGQPIVGELMAAWGGGAANDLLEILDDLNRLSAAAVAVRLRSLDPASAARLATMPSVVLWTAVARAHRGGRAVRCLDGNPIEFDPEYVETIAQLANDVVRVPLVHRDDHWLRAPFGPPIRFEQGEDVRQGRVLTEAALDLISSWSPAFRREIGQLSPEIQFVVDDSASSDKCVSFSDDAVPGALYVGLRAGGTQIDAWDLADSLIHEHRHQKLYLLSRATALVAQDYPFVSSPWREDPRPPSGLLHACFVFAELRRFWAFALANGESEVRSRATATLELIDDRLAQAWRTLQDVRLAPAGERLVAALRDSM
jgi:uncharacterized protein